MASWDEIKNNVENNGNVLTVSMEQLREAHGAAKLGVHVRDQISATLAGMGWATYQSFFRVTSKSL